MSSIELLTSDIAGRTSWLLSELQISQRGMADRIGVAQTFVSAVSRGRSLPSIAMLAGLSREFHVDLNWYVIGLGEPFTAQTQNHDEQAPSARPELIDDLLPRVLALGPEQAGRVQGFLEAILVLQSDTRRAQARPGELIPKLRLVWDRDDNGKGRPEAQRRPHPSTHERR